MSNSTLYNRVRETTTVTSTGTATLLGAASGYQSFAAVGNGNTTFYTIADQNGGPNWEVGVGTYTLSGTTLSRTTVLASSNSGSLVNFTAGTKDVFIDAPASLLNNFAALTQANAFTKLAFSVVSQTQITTAQAGVGLTITADSAVAGSSVAGAAAGGNITLTAGNAAQFTSGNAAGGNIVATPGAGIGTGAAGVFVVQNPDGNTAHQVQISHNGTDPIWNAPVGAGQIVRFNLNGSTSVRIDSSGNVVANGNYYVGSIDTSITRLAAGVVGAGNWFQNTAGCKVLNANATNATNTLAASNLTVTLIAGRSYPIKMKISGGNSTVTEGFQFALVADGTLTATTFDLEVVGVIGTEVTGTQRVTALGTPITFTTFTQPTDVYLVGSIKCGVGGVGTIQFAEQSTHVSGTATLNAGSWIDFEDGVAV